MKNFFVGSVVFIWCSLFGEVSIARDPQWMGLSLLGRQAAILAFSDELVRDIAKEEDFSVALYPGNPGSLFDDLDRGVIDAILSSQQPFAGLRDRYAFSKPYIRTGPVLVVRADSKIDAFWKLTGKIVGVRAGSEARMIAAEVPLIDIDTYPSDAVALDELAEGKIDGVLMPAIPAYAFVADLYSGVLRIVTPPLNDEGIRLVTLKENEKLVKKFDEGLEKLIQRGRYKALARKWQLHLTSRGL